MIRQKRMMVALTGALVGGIGLTLWAAELTFENLPPAVQKTLRALAGPGTEFVEVEAEKEGGVQVYEASWLVNGREVEAEVTAEGLLLEMEESVDAKDVPEAVRVAAEKALAGATKLSYEKHTVVLYEVEGRVDGKEKEVTISPTGRVIGQEEEDEDDDEEEDDK